MPEVDSATRKRVQYERSRTTRELEQRLARLAKLEKALSTLRKNAEKTDAANKPEIANKRLASKYNFVQLRKKWINNAENEPITNRLLLSENDCSKKVEIRNVVHILKEKEVEGQGVGHLHGGGAEKTWRVGAGARNTGNTHLLLSTKGLWFFTIFSYFAFSKIFDNYTVTIHNYPRPLYNIGR